MSTVVATLLRVNLVGALLSAISLTAELPDLFRKPMGVFVQEVIEQGRVTLGVIGAYCHPKASHQLLPGRHDVRTARAAFANSTSS